MRGFGCADPTRDKQREMQGLRDDTGSVRLKITVKFNILKTLRRGLFVTPIEQRDRGSLEKNTNCLVITINKIRHQLATHDND